MFFRTEKQRTFAGNALVAAILCCVVYSGFAYPLSYGGGLWPWNRDWFMFSSDSGYDYELQALAETKEGKLETLDLSYLFHFPVGANGNRFQAMPRDNESMKKLAEYLCANFKVRWITLNDLSWERQPGPRLQAKQLPPQKISTNTWVNHLPCSS